MDALRYLICGIDAHRLAKSAHTANVPLDPKTQPQPPAKAKQRPWLRYDNEELWTPLN